MSVLSTSVFGVMMSRSVKTPISNEVLNVPVTPLPDMTMASC